MSVMRQFTGVFLGLLLLGSVAACQSIFTETGASDHHLMVLTNAFSLIEENYVDPVDGELLAQNAVKGMERYLREYRISSAGKIGDMDFNQNGKSRAIGYLSASFNKIVRSTSVHPRELQYAAINGMMKSLDPYSVYLSPELYEDLKAFTRGEYCGLGVEVAMIDNFITVVSPIDDTPAYYAGLKPGDRIVEINGESTAGYTINDAFRVLRGVPGTSVTITVARATAKSPLVLTIRRQNIILKSVKTRVLKDGVGYIRIASFHETTTREFRDALNELGEKADLSKGLILDLRNNPGGLLNEALGLSDIFLGSGIIAVSRGRAAFTSQIYRAIDDGDEITCPLIVLINNGTASASEVVAFALHHNDRALLLGSKTLGKVTIQSVTELSDGSALKLTMARYHTSSKEALQSIGVRPDLYILHESGAGRPYTGEPYSGNGGSDALVWKSEGLGNQGLPCIIVDARFAGDAPLHIARHLLAAGRGLPPPDRLQVLARQALNM